MEGLLPGERIDDLMRNGLKLIQQEDGFRFGTDSVLLADFAIYGRMERVADLGTGSGILPILMADACPGARFDAIELDAAAANRARRSVEMNGLAGRIRVHCMDMRVAAQNLGYGAFGACVCNPPYGKKGGALASARQDIRLARHEGEVSIEDVCTCAAQLLKNGGRLSVVFPAPRANELLRAMEGARLAPKRMRLVESFAGKPPKLVLADAVKGGGSQMHWLPTLVLYEADGSPTLEYRKIYRM